MSKKIICPNCKELVITGNYCEICGSKLLNAESKIIHEKNKKFDTNFESLAGNLVDSILGNSTQKDELKEDISKAAESGKNFIKNTVESASDFLDENLENYGRIKINIEDDSEDNDDSEVKNPQVFNSMDLKGVELKQNDFTDEKLKKDKKLLELEIISEEEFKKLNN